ncbi:hypothetical protein TUM15784_04160 [Neisseria gonorrhoeae]|nr:hypothetical protein [Neisseria gonorrhoeae]GFL77714.1 hypothetical protein TUM15784_04160 [Neisseria gonorrhoeae]
MQNIKSGKRLKIDTVTQSKTGFCPNAGADLPLTAAEQPDRRPSLSVKPPFTPKYVNCACGCR